MARRILKWTAIGLLGLVVLLAVALAAAVLLLRTDAGRERLTAEELARAMQEATTPLEEPQPTGRHELPEDSGTAGKSARGNDRRRPR